MFMSFQLTHSRGVRRSAQTPKGKSYAFQLTHSRGVRLGEKVVLCHTWDISTHALTWSATVLLWWSTIPRRSFQLTHSRGVRQSILWNIAYDSQFQLTHSRGVRLFGMILPTSDVTFQLTHSRGVRPLLARSLCCCGDFNSRTHVECDSKYCIKKRFTTQYMGIHCFLSSIILIFFIYSKK